MVIVLENDPAIYRAADIRSAHPIIP